MLEMKIKIEADAAVLKAIDKLTTALEKNAVNISVPQDAPAPVAPVAAPVTHAPVPPVTKPPATAVPKNPTPPPVAPPLRLWQPLPLHRLLRHLPRLWPLLTPLPLFP